MKPSIRHKPASVRASDDQRWAGTLTIVALFGGTALLVVSFLFAVKFGGSKDWLSHDEPFDTRSLSNAYQAMPVHNITFRECGRFRVNCVVDGDTFWLNGEKIRIADVDTPEISQPRCRHEYELGILAKQRLIDILNSGDFFLETSSWGDRDRYGRTLRKITRGGDSIGRQLVREGLGHEWDGRRHPWC